MEHLRKCDTELNQKELLRLGKLLILTASAIGAYALIFGGFVYLLGDNYGLESFIGCLVVFFVSYLAYFAAKEKRAGRSPSSILEAKVKSFADIASNAKQLPKTVAKFFDDLFTVFRSLFILLPRLGGRAGLFLLKVIGIGLLIWFAVWLILAIGPLWLIVFLLALVVLYLFLH